MIWHSLLLWFLCHQILLQNHQLRYPSTSSPHHQSPAIILPVRKKEREKEKNTNWWSIDRLVYEPHQRNKDGTSFAIIDNKSKASIKILDNLISRVWTPITKSPISFDNKHGLVSPLCQTILPIQYTQVVQAPQEQAVYILKPTKQPEIMSIAHKINIIGKAACRKLQVLAGNFITYLPLMLWERVVRANIGKDGSFTKAHGESVVWIMREELSQSLFWKLGLLITISRCRTVELIWWISKSFVEYGQHFFFSFSLFECERY